MSYQTEIDRILYAKAGLRTYLLYHDIDYSDDERIDVLVGKLPSLAPTTYTVTLAYDSNAKGVVSWEVLNNSATSTGTNLVYEIDAGGLLDLRLTTQNSRVISGITATVDETTIDISSYITQTSSGLENTNCRYWHITDLPVNGNITLTVSADVYYNMTTQIENATYTLSSSWVQSGDHCVWTATPNTGYEFVNDTSNNNIIGSSTFKLYSGSSDYAETYNGRHTISFNNGVVKFQVNSISSNLEFRATATKIASSNVSTYRVEKEEETATYEFIQDGEWWVRSNGGQANSYALSRIIFNCPEATTVTFTVYNYAEATYDYGLLSNINCTLTSGYASSAYQTDLSAGNIKFNGYSSTAHSATEQIVTYDLPAGESFIMAKYRKDSSSNVNDDMFKFKISGAVLEGEESGGSASNSYTVDAIENATYGFTLADDDWYTSTNKGVSDSYSIARINFNIASECTAKITDYVDCEQYTDYGVIGILDTALPLSTNWDSVNSAVVDMGYGEEVVEVALTPGTHFIDIKYVKMSSSNEYGDYLKFKVELI